MGFGIFMTFSPMVVSFQDARAPSDLFLVFVLVVSISEFFPTQASLPSRASGVKRSFHFLFPKIQVPFCGGGLAGRGLRAACCRCRIGQLAGEGCFRVLHRFAQSHAAASCGHHSGSKLPAVHGPYHSRCLPWRRLSAKEDGTDHQV
jgi:hypothetical protein